jgi:predicted dinucleotide-binding enzyme
MRELLEDTTNQEEVVASVSIIGTGNMGAAIASIALKGGHKVQQLGHGDGAIAIEGHVVILAVPHADLADIVAQRGEALVDKVVVDITNPVDFDTMDGLVVGSDTSAAAALADALPRSAIVKAFNTNFAGTLAGGTVGPLTTAVLVAGDDEEAKAQVVALVTSGGLNGVDAGALKRARELEALGFLQITLAAREQISWAAGFAIQN